MVVIKVLYNARCGRKFGAIVMAPKPPVALQAHHAGIPGTVPRDTLAVLLHDANSPPPGKAWPFTGMKKASACALAHV
jgi:hypothetical protein